MMATRVPADRNPDDLLTDAERAEFDAIARGLMAMALETRAIVDAIPAVRTIRDAAAIMQRTYDLSTVLMVNAK